MRGYLACNIMMQGSVEVRWSDSTVCERCGPLVIDSIVLWQAVVCLLAISAMPIICISGRDEPDNVASRDAKVVQTSTINTEAVYLMLLQGSLRSTPSRMNVQDRRLTEIGSKNGQDSWQHHRNPELKAPPR